MANSKRIVQKIPLLITNGPSWSWEYEEKEYGLKKFRRNAPDEYASYVNKLNNLYNEIEQKVIDQRKKHNGHGK